MAKYLALAKLPVALEIVILSNMLTYGLLSDNLFTHFANQFSSIGEFIVTAIVISKQLNQMRKKEEEA